MYVVCVVAVFYYHIWSVFLNTFLMDVLVLYSCGLNCCSVVAACLLYHVLFVFCACLINLFVFCWMCYYYYSCWCVLFFVNVLFGVVGCVLCLLTSCLFWLFRSVLDACLSFLVYHVCFVLLLLYDYGVCFSACLSFMVLFRFLFVNVVVCFVCLCLVCDVCCVCVFYHVWVVVVFFVLFLLGAFWFTVMCCLLCVVCCVSVFVQCVFWLFAFVVVSVFHVVLIMSGLMCVFLVLVCLLYVGCYMCVFLALMCCCRVVNVLF